MKTTETTNSLIRDWALCRKRAEQAKRELSAAETALANATNALGKWLVPLEAVGEEPFNLWVGSGILTASRLKNHTNDYAVHWRKKPEGKEAAEFGL
jgi:hypothetical protein